MRLSHRHDVPIGRDSQEVICVLAHGSKSLRLESAFLRLETNRMILWLRRHILANQSQQEHVNLQVGIQGLEKALRRSLDTVLKVPLISPHE